jgi:hydroxyacylglutathione hydrolase
MNLLALPAFADNYIWLLHDGNDAVVVDPGDCAPVIQALDKFNLRLVQVLVTHHHGDHVGGLAGLRERLHGEVIGPATEDIPGPLRPVRGGDRVSVLGQDFEVIDVPGHTAGHIAYFFAGGEEVDNGPILFCGDTLFSGGCGRLFEGTALQMHTSLQRLSSLPGSTRVCCAHEYTLANLKFAHAVEPANRALAAYTTHCEHLRAAGLPTLPGRLSDEAAINPFLRCTEAEVIRSARSRVPGATSPVEVFAALRQWKNEF